MYIVLGRGMNTQHSNSLQKLVENASQLSQGLETLKLQNGTLLDGLSRQEEDTNRRKLCTRCVNVVVCTVTVHDISNEVWIQFLV